MTMSPRRAPAVWLPTLRAGTGADVFTRRLCAGLAARGIRAEIAWLPHRAEYLPWTVAVPKPPDWANVVHLNSWLPRRFWPAGIPALVTVHHLVHDPAYRPFRSPAQAAYHALVIRGREARALRDAEAVTTVSGYVRRTLEAFSGRQDVAVVHNWVDAGAFVPAAAAGARSAGPFRLFMAGSRTRRKGFDLLPALAGALGAGFEIRHAGGSGPPGLPIPGVVELGRISEIALIREYQACDVVVSLSRYEGFGYTALEGMACGKPFIGFGGSGLDEVVEQGVQGFLCEVDDVASLAARCRQLAGDRDRLERMGTAARLRATSQFTASEALDAYVDAYARILRPPVGATTREGRDG